MSKNKIKIIIGILGTIILLLGGTYAAWNFLTEKTSVTMLVGGDQISFDAGTNIMIDKILPVYSMEEGITKDITIYKEDGDYTAGIDLYLNLKTWPTYMSSASFRWAVYKNGAYLSSGDFSNTSQGNNIKLTSYTQKINLEEKKDTYKLYLWIDAYQESNINMMNRQFTVNLYGQVSFYTDDDPTVNEAEPNAPDLAEGMIPIKYNYVIDEWVKADVNNTNNDWYDYYNKMWANAVMVTSDTREEYMNVSVGTTVSNDDILAYYVWIPRYKYVLFNVDSITMDPIEIQIEFQKETDEIFNGTQNGEYLTHPAFWWDNDSDEVREAGEELAGIWVGKFETTRVNNEPYIKPNIMSISGYSLYQNFIINQKFKNTTYISENGSNAVDAHMIKNMEYGAVAYLSHSRYGKIGKILTTGNTDCFTGRNSNYTYNDFYVDGSIITLSKGAGMGTEMSTTGNVYGIYDTAGCIQDGVMSLMKNTNGELFYNGTGFNKNNIPEVKYYDLYDYNELANNYSIRKLGDATGETRNWYGGDAVSILYSGSGFYERGYKGMFSFSRVHPGAPTRPSSRSIIIIP